MFFNILLLLDLYNKIINYKNINFKLFKKKYIIYIIYIEKIEIIL